MIKRFLPVSFTNTGTGNTYQTTYQTDVPIGNDADADTYGYVSIAAYGSGTISFRYYFDLSSIPSDVVIRSAVCKAKARYGGTSSGATIAFYRGNTSSTKTLTSSAAVYTWDLGSGLTAGDFENCYIRITVPKSSTTSVQGYFYGAQIDVEYDPPIAAPEVTAVGQYRGIRLSWTPVEKAQTYRILRNGVQIDETDALTYTDEDTWEGETYTYTVFSVSDGTLSEGTEITVTGCRPRFITDRTYADVLAKNGRGTYNASDLNRVAEAVGYVREMLDAYGYAVPEKPKSDWQTNDIPTETPMRTHIEAVRGLDVIRYAGEKIPLPETLENLDFRSANNIEKFLIAAGVAAEKIPDAWMYSGETDCGT